VKNITTFHLQGDKLTCTSTIEHAIPTQTVGMHRAVNVKPYRIPEVHKDEMQRQTEQMVADGVIQHSTSPWNSPILVVLHYIES
jgi:stalled ribosome rescue protein Dom34